MQELLELSGHLVAKSNLQYNDHMFFFVLFFVSGIWPCSSYNFLGANPGFLRFRCRNSHVITHVTHVTHIKTMNDAI